MRQLRDLLFVASAAPEDDLSRAAAARSTIAIAGAAFCLSMACAFTMPILFGADERVHLAYVEVLLSGELPEVDQDVPLDGHFGVLREFYPDGTEGSGPRGDVWVAGHPPLSYLVAVPPAWLAASVGYDRGPPMILRVLCGLGMALGVLATAAVSDALLPARRRSAVLAAALAAFTPMLVSVGSYGFNDGAAFAAGTALLAAVLRVARFGPTRNRLVGTVCLAVVAALTRSALLPLVPIAAAVWLIRSWGTGRRSALMGAALVAVVPAIAGGWFYLRNIDLYGSFSGSGYLQAKFDRARTGSTFDLLRNPRFLLGAWQDLWGSFRSNLGVGSGYGIVGSPNAQIGSRIVIGASLVVASALGLLASLVQRRRRQPNGGFTWAVAAVWAAICIVALASFASGGGSPHPRYLIPAHAVTVTVIVAGLSRLPWGRLVVPATILGIVSIDLLLFSRLPVLLVERPWPSRFAQPGSSTVVVLLALGAGVAAGARAVGALRDVQD